MLIRTTPGGRMCISQPAHAWVSGQIARAWGNAEFGTFAPWEDVCLAAEQHDIGWMPWEMHPTLNPETGYPYHFTEMPTPDHVGIWSRTQQFTLPFGPYPALLVSLHGTRLYEAHTRWQQSPEARPLVEQFLHQEVQFRDRLLHGMNADMDYRPWIDEEVLQRNRRLIATWDWLSILLCLGVTQTQQIDDVPCAHGATRLSLTPIASDPARIGVSPWPFQPESLTLTVTGRILNHPETNERDLQSRYPDAPWNRLAIALSPA